MIGIIILNYNNWPLTKECLNSIFKVLCKEAVHVYLVDNASPNQTPKDYLKEYDISRISLIQNERNNGYAAGNNVGIKKALDDGCDSILIANNDVIFVDNSLINMATYLMENKEHRIGIVGPKILNPNGSVSPITLCIKTDLKVKYLVKSILSKIPTKTKKRYYGDGFDLSKPCKVYSVHGSCFLMSRECALDITPLDEHTFLYEEESIIGVRMEEKRYSTIYYPICSIIHKHAQSTGKVKAIPYICLAESELYYCKIYLNESVIRILPLYIMRTIGYFMRMVKYKSYREHLKEYFSRTLKELKSN